MSSIFKWFSSERIPKYERAREDAPNEYIIYIDSLIDGLCETVEREGNEIAVKEIEGSDPEFSDVGVIKPDEDGYKSSLSDYLDKSHDIKENNAEIRSRVEMKIDNERNRRMDIMNNMKNKGKLARQEEVRRNRFFYDSIADESSESTSESGSYTDSCYTSSSGSGSSTSATSSSYTGSTSSESTSNSNDESYLAGVFVFIDIFEIQILFDTGRFLSFAYPCLKKVELTSFGSI